MAALGVSTTPAPAQGPRGAGPDARTPGTGTLRVSLGASWLRSPEDYRDGVLREAGFAFALDTLGTGAIRSLTGAQAATRLAAGMPGFEASLGALRAHARRATETTPILIEYGVGRRAALSLLVPFVTSAVRVDAVANPLRTEANVGMNPALATPALLDANRALLTQLDAATGFLNGRIASCAANPGGVGCAAVNANTAGARALADATLVYSTAVGAVYGGRDGAAGSLFVPLAGSAAQAAVAARLAGFKAQLAAFGAPAITAGPPVGAPAPLTTTDFQAVLTDSTFGIIGQPLASVVRRGVGNVEVGGLVTLHDSYSRAAATGPWRGRFWWRGAVGATLRLGAGRDEPDLFAAAPIADAGRDLELRSVTDVGVGARLSLTAALRFTRRAAVTTSLRVPDAPGDPFPEAFRAISATRDPGDEVGIELFPRWTASEAVAIAAFYGFRRRSADLFSGTATTTDAFGESHALDAAVLTESGASAEHRVGASLAYSTVAAWERGRARWPLELSVTHFQTTRGSGPLVPKLAFDAVQLRWYWRAFGAGPRQ